MENTNIQKPCLVNTAQGFSVSYNNKFLYSKYNPSKIICQTIENLNILPGTLFLCCSPVLPYGLTELLNKLPENCFLLICEIDEVLKSFSNECCNNQELKTNWEIINKSNLIAVPDKNELFSLPQILNLPEYTFNDGKKLPKAGSFKRVIKIDFSSGVQFHNEFYSTLTQACVNALMTFWSNRVTLVRFGRNYSRNFFENLKILTSTKPIENYIKTISKPIIIFGAGQSIDKGIEHIKNKWQNYFILCTDTSYTSLMQNGIIPDGVFVEEAQPVILKAFIGTKNNPKTQIFTSLSSLPSINHNFPAEQISFFTTLYTECNFLNKLVDSKIIPITNPPMGSVGLTTVYYALKFRKTTSVPIYLYGLDFSYSEYFTHGKGTMAHTNRLFSSNRFLPVQNYKAAYNDTVFSFIEKSGKTFYSTHILSSYANNFIALFSEQPNLYDSGEVGFDLKLKTAIPTDICFSDNPIQKELTSFSEEQITKVKDFINSETAALEELRDILSGTKKLSPEEATNKIIELSKQREYLYLHFPDGWNYNTSLPFLKRIRVEIDYFLKLLKK